MKRIIISLITFWGLFTLASSQVNKDIIEIDFSEKSITSPNIKSIKKSGYYQIKIKNINLNLYKVSLTSVDTILSKPQQTPAFGNFNLDAISKIVAGVSPISLPQLKTDSIGLKDFIFNRIKAEESLLMKDRNRIENIALRIDRLKLEIYKYRLNSYTLQNTNSNFNLTGILDSIEIIRNDLFSLKTEILKDKSSYEQFSDNNNIAITSKPDLKTKDKSIKELYDKYLNAMTDGLSSISADKTNELLSTIVFLENNKDNTYLSLPFQFTGEQTKVKISIIPRDEKYNLQSYHTQIVFPQTIKNYTVVGLSLYGSNLYSKSYSIIENPLDTTFIIKEDGNISKGELGISALLHYGMSCSDTTKFGLHVNLGAGISISDDIKPRFLAGVGISCGEKHKLVFDFGYIVGYVDELSNAYKIDKEYRAKPENIAISVIDHGMFGSLGYVYQF